MPKSWKNKSVHLTEESRFTVENAYIEDALLVSGPGSDSGIGGLYYVKRSGWMGGTEVWCMDRLSSRGIDANAEMLVRALHSDGHMVITVYTSDSARTFVKEGLGNIHGVKIVDDKIYAVSTTSNEVVCLDSEGNILKNWQFPGGKDAWHMSGVDLWDNRVVVCAFGRFEGESGYVGKTNGAGVVFDLESGKDVWSGLTGPHSPRCDKSGNKYICDSGTKRLIVKEATGGERVIDCKTAFPRGLAIGKGMIYLGLSFLDSNGEAGASSKILMLDPETLEKMGELEMDIPEIYDILIIGDES